MNFSYSSFKYFTNKNIFKGGLNRKSFGMFNCHSNLMSKYFLSNMSNKIHSISLIKPLTSQTNNTNQTNGNGVNLYNDPEMEVSSSDANSMIKEYIQGTGINAVATMLGRRMINLQFLRIDGKNLNINLEQLCTLGKQHSVRI